MCHVLVLVYVPLCVHVLTRLSSLLELNVVALAFLSSSCFCPVCVSLPGCGHYKNIKTTHTYQKATAAPRADAAIPPNLLLFMLLYAPELSPPVGGAGVGGTGVGAGPLSVSSSRQSQVGAIKPAVTGHKAAVITLTTTTDDDDFDDDEVCERDERNGLHE